MDVSIIIPIKDERDNLRPLHERLRLSLDPLGREYELVFVDDGSVDRTYKLLREIVTIDSRVVVVKLPFPVPATSSRRPERSETADTAGEQIIAPILAAVTPRTKLALLDHVTSQTGLVLPVARLVREFA